MLPAYRAVDDAAAAIPACSHLDRLHRRGLERPGADPETDAGHDERDDQVHGRDPGAEDGERRHAGSEQTHADDRRRAPSEAVGQPTADRCEQDHARRHRHEHETDARLGPAGRRSSSSGTARSSAYIVRFESAIPPVAATNPRRRKNRGWTTGSGIRSSRHEEQHKPDRDDRDRHERGARRDVAQRA